MADISISTSCPGALMKMDNLCIKTLAGCKIELENLTQWNSHCHVKEENQDHLSEENNPVLYTDSAGISNYDSDPLMTDELSDRVTYKCTSVKEDQISDDEEGLHVLNDCSDGVTNKLMHQDSSDQPNTLTAFQGEKVEAQSRGDIVVDLDAMPIGAKKGLSPEENAQIQR
ncbi:uncharacterized protein LOC124173264 [Ischnura elegans]|uniref:uncharacterized protein LOC124173262 n=1 Tax=Ischnura elegans TaxID=197161 RepID=UPI001ED8A300|nr:uncharacterized protein LOC124173262 [Ischnura elegans]XP_046408738.1 uncharacterized protein LOC124173264 [Ischnura elegans]